MPHSMSNRQPVPNWVAHTRWAMTVELERRRLYDRFQALGERELVFGEIGVDPPILDFGEYFSDERSFRHACEHDFASTQRKTRPLPGVGDGEQHAPLNGVGIFCVIGPFEKDAIFERADIDAIE